MIKQYTTFWSSPEDAMRDMADFLTENRDRVDYLVSSVVAHGGGMFYGQLFYAVKDDK